MQMSIDELFQLVHILIVDPAAGEQSDATPDQAEQIIAPLVDEHEPARPLSRERMEELTEVYLNDLVMWVRANFGMSNFVQPITMLTLHRCFRRLYHELPFDDIVPDASMSAQIRGLYLDAAGALAEGNVPL